MWLSETWSALAQALQGHTWKGSPRLLIDLSLREGAWAWVRARASHSPCLDDMSWEALL